MTTSPNNEGPETGIPRPSKEITNSERSYSTHVKGIGRRTRPSASRADTRPADSQRNFARGGLAVARSVALSAERGGLEHVSIALAALLVDRWLG